MAGPRPGRCRLLALLLGGLGLLQADAALLGNGRIATAGNETGSWELWSFRPDGTDPQQLTDTGGVNAHPSFSPDGTQLGLDWNLCIADADGGSPRELTTGNWTDIVPSFSADGSYVVFESNRLGQNFTIFRIPANLTEEGGGKVTPLLPHHDLAVNDMGVKCSPDGSTIAFASDRGNGPGNYEIWLMDVGGSNLRPLTTSAHNSFSRSFSPDGSKLAFNSMQDSTGSGKLVGQICTINIDGSGLRCLTNSTSSWSYSPGGIFPTFTGTITPAWSPDGTRIAYASGGADPDDPGFHEAYEVYTMSAEDGSDVQHVTHLSDANAFHISVGWQPVPPAEAAPAPAPLPADAAAAPSPASAAAGIAASRLMGLVGAAGLAAVVALM
ncbi:hypothetical protein ABPG75_011469 [Micractinium tetrahymenae]